MAISILPDQPFFKVIPTIVRHILRKWHKISPDSIFRNESDSIFRNGENHIYIRKSKMAKSIFRNGENAHLHS